jgi:hypothetical protein
MNEVANFHQLLENWIDNGRGNDKWWCQPAGCQRLNFSIRWVQKI